MLYVLIEINTTADSVFRWMEKNGIASIVEMLVDEKTRERKSRETGQTVLEVSKTFDEKEITVRSIHIHPEWSFNISDFMICVDVGNTRSPPVEVLIERLCFLLESTDLSSYASSWEVRIRSDNTGTATKEYGKKTLTQGEPIIGNTGEAQ